MIGTRLGTKRKPQQDQNWSLSSFWFVFHPDTLRLGL
jgi:hypothetical protein